MGFRFITLQVMLVMQFNRSWVNCMTYEVM